MKLETPSQTLNRYRKMYARAKSSFVKDIIKIRAEKLKTLVTKNTLTTATPVKLPLDKSKQVV